jgi:hypothetical protein
MLAGRSGVMPHRTRIPLQEGTAVHLDLGGVSGVVSGRISGLLGSLILVHAVEDDSGRLQARIPAAARGYVVTAGADANTALACSVESITGTSVAVRVTDRFVVPAQRRWSRMRIRLEATLTPLGTGEAPVHTATIDVSPTGARLHRPEGVSPWPRLDIELGGPELAEGPVGVRASTVRAGAGFIAVRFTEIADADERRLIAALLRHLSTLA